MAEETTSPAPAAETSSAQDSGPPPNSMDAALEQRFAGIRNQHLSEESDGASEDETPSEVEAPEPESDPSSPEQSPEAQPPSEEDTPDGEAGEGGEPSTEEEAPATAAETITIGGKEYPTSEIEQLVRSTEQLVGYKDALERQRRQLDEAIQSFTTQRQEFESQRAEREQSREREQSIFDFIGWQEREQLEGRSGTMQEYILRQKDLAEQDKNRPLSREDVLDILRQDRENQAKERATAERNARMQQTEASVDMWVPQLVSEAFQGKLKGDLLLDHAAAVTSRVGRTLAARGVSQDQFLNARPDEIQGFIKMVATQYAKDFARERSDFLVGQVEDAVNGKKPLPAAPKTTQGSRAPNQPKMFRAPDVRESRTMDGYFENYFSNLRERTQNLDREARDL